MLTDPGPHIGKSYRPTGPELLSPCDIADILTNVVGRKVKYQDGSIKMFAKAAKALGVSDFETSQISYCVEELRRGVFEAGAPTDHVERITGRKPESSEAIARRYIDNPSLIDPRLKKGGKLEAMAFVARVMLSRPPNFDRWERERGHPLLNEVVLASDNPEWRASAEKQELYLLPGASQDDTGVPPNELGL